MKKDCRRFQAGLPKIRAGIDSVEENDWDEELANLALDALAEDEAGEQVEDVEDKEWTDDEDQEKRPSFLSQFSPQATATTRSPLTTPSATTWSWSEKIRKEQEETRKKVEEVMKRSSASSPKTELITPPRRPMHRG